MWENIFAFLQLHSQMYVQSEKFLQLGEKSSRDPIWRTDDEDDSRLFFAIFFMIVFLSSQFLVVGFVVIMKELKHVCVTYKVSRERK